MKITLAPGLQLLNFFKGRFVPIQKVSHQPHQGQQDIVRRARQIAKKNAKAV